MTELDRAFRGAQAGNAEAFAAWVAHVELPLRTSLRRFSRNLDIEVIVQEGLIRMWRLAAGVALEGENASLRYALRLVRNLAISELRRLGRRRKAEETFGDDPTECVDPEPLSDRRLREMIQKCMERLPEQPRRVLRIRIEETGIVADRDLAERLRMTRNTFFQNLSRARKLVGACLEKHGLVLREVLR